MDNRRTWVDEIKSKVDNFFTGDEGSIFHIIRLCIDGIKFLIQSCNDWLSLKRAERSMDDE